MKQTARTCVLVNVFASYLGPRREDQTLKRVRPGPLLQYTDPCHRIFQQLPTHNYRTTAYLFAFLNKVAANSAINKMGHVNLATVASFAQVEEHL